MAKKVKKPAPKKPAAKKPAAKKPAPKAKAKPVAKKPVAKSKPAPKAKAKPAPKAKPVAKKPAPKAKPAPAPKKAAKPVAKPAPAKPVAVAKPVLPPTKAITKPTVVKQPKAAEAVDPRSRYSDEELVEFKQLIDKKLGEATRDYELLKNTLSHKDDHGTDDTSPTFKLLEDGSDVLSKEETAHLAARQEKYIQNLKNALVRIQNKTYGICRVTGKLIPKERLRSVPHATLSIDAKLNQNR
jgi:RNA polymerase-binding transcription factor DksA